MGIPDHDFQLLTTCGDSSEAALLRGMLEANGIPCIVQGEQHRSMLGVAGAYIEVRVLVPSDEMERARELLKSVPQEEPPGNGIAVTLEPNTEGAHCAVHGQHATQACKRCGNFLCERCDGANAGLCEDCADLKDSDAQVQRGRKRRVVAWLILLSMFGPLLLIILSNLLFALLH